jgi:hypothetical protein
MNVSVPIARDHSLAPERVDAPLFGAVAFGLADILVPSSEERR